MNLKSITKTLMVAATMLALNVSAQNGQTSNFKFSSGDRNLELQLVPLSLNNSPITLNGIKFRYFTSENAALRLNVNLNSNSNTNITQMGVDSTDTPELKEKTSSFGFKLAPGYEMHFSGTNKLSPYVGGELVIDYQTNSFREETETIDNKVVYTKTSNSSSGDNTPGYFGLSLNGIAGFDFYFTKSLYLGTELNYGLTLKSNLSTKIKSDQEGFTASDPQKNGSSMSFAPMAVGQFKLGFLF
ncbi:MAG: hypothetical protein CMP67_00280 [Flavobacteriales bacterium]|nr:hypothetical protein [Flavobacteriales bacterium]|tara:strand:- start:22473 stop:23201 length:729 start_codon:yes stop_codon:yes gene_type:complete